MWEPRVDADQWQVPHRPHEAQKRRGEKRCETGLKPWQREATPTAFLAQTGDQREYHRRRQEVGQPPGGSMLGRVGTPRGRRVRPAR
jgi:hypothetical protein